MEEVIKLITRSQEILDSIIDKPTVDKEKVVPLMNELAAIVGKLYLHSHSVADKAESRKIKDLIKGLEALIGTLKYQYKAYSEILNGVDT